MGMEGTEVGRASSPRRTALATWPGRAPFSRKQFTYRSHSRSHNLQCWGQSVLPVVFQSRSGGTSGCHNAAAAPGTSRVGPGCPEGVRRASPSAHN